MERSGGDQEKRGMTGSRSHTDIRAKEVTALETVDEEGPRAPVVTILAGGSGTRFWPLSTRAKPKQFLTLLGGCSLLQESFRRALLLTTADRVLVLTNEALVAQVREQLPGLPSANVVAEPLRRDTAAAICLAAVLQQREWGRVVNVVLTSDHHISPDQEFARVMLSAARAAAATPCLYTVGVCPAHPATGYGYLCRGSLLFTEGGLGHYAVEGYREKPSQEIAEEYVASGNYLWNSGMFVWRNDVLLAQFERLLPRHVHAITGACTAGVPAREDLLRAFEQLPAVSIDYGIMEQAPDVRVVEATFGWSDLGGWPALREYLEHDETCNAHRGRLAALDAGGNLVFCENEDELVALVGVSDLVVVRAGDKTLILPCSRAEELKGLVALLDERGQGRDL